MNLLDTYVRGWRESTEAILALAPDLDEADWLAPTDCPGWTVKDVVAHLAHIETELTHAEQNEHANAGATEVVSAYTALGVEDRRDRTPLEVTAELAASTKIRLGQLATMPHDPTAMAPVTPGGIAWSWDTLLRNRSIDAWVHEQDIRRAVGRPGGLASTGAQVAVMTFSLAMPYVLGKRVRPAPGSTVRWEVTGETPLELVVQIGDDGRAAAIEFFEQPSVTLSMSTEAFTVLAAGRRAPADVPVTIDGDHELGRMTLAAMAITP